MDNELIQKTKLIATDSLLSPPAVCAFIEVETGWRGLDPKTGKIIIQFEPRWFRHFHPNAPLGLWSQNVVDVQAAEWLAFNDAFQISPDAAMQSTSIGLGQIMGFHFARLGYKTVGEMWDDAKSGIERQIWQICKFINTDAKLKTALNNRDWHTVASIYNGAGYKALAAKLGREPYDISFAKAYEKFSKIV